MDWQPIETAPEDGTTVELLGANGKLDIGEWCEYGKPFGKNDVGIPEAQTGEFSTEYGESPHTHWRPLDPNVYVTGTRRGHRAAPVDCRVRWHWKRRTSGETY